MVYLGSLLLALLGLTSILMAVRLYRSSTVPNAAVKMLFALMPIVVGVACLFAAVFRLFTI